MNRGRSFFQILGHLHEAGLVAMVGRPFLFSGIKRQLGSWAQDVEMGGDSQL